MGQTQKRLPIITEIERLVSDQMDAINGPLTALEVVEYAERAKRMDELFKRIARNAPSESTN